MRLEKAPRFVLTNQDGGSLSPTSDCLCEPYLNAKFTIDMCKDIWGEMATYKYSSQENLSDWRRNLVGTTAQLGCLRIESNYCTLFCMQIPLRTNSSI